MRVTGIRLLRIKYFKKFPAGREFLFGAVSFYVAPIWG
jgi:hypothetical protein